MSLGMEKIVERGIGPTYSQRVVRSFAWRGIAQIAGQICTWTSTLIVIRLLAPGDYGLMAMASIFISLFFVFGDLGLGAAVIQAPTLAPDQLKRLFGIVLVVNALGCAMILICAPTIATFFGEPRLVLIIQVLMINFLLVALYTLPQSQLMRDLEFGLLARVDMTAALSAASTSLLLAYLGFGVWALVGSTLISHGVKVIGLNLLRPTPLVPIFSLSSLSGLAGFGLLVTLDRLLFFMYGQVDVLIGGRFLGKEALGLYAVALSLATIPMEKILPVITQVSFAAFSQIQADLTRVQRNLLRGFRIVSLMCFPACLGMAAVAGDLVPVVLGSGWNGMIVPLQILCLVLPFKIIAALFPPALFGVGRPEVNVRNMAISMVAMTLAMLMGVQFGVIGLCLAWLIAYPLVFVVIVRNALTALEVGLRDFLGSVAFPIAGSLAMSIALTGLQELLSLSGPSPLRLAVLILVGVAIYAVLVVSFQRRAVRDLYAAIRG